MRRSSAVHLPPPVLLGGMTAVGCAASCGRIQSHVPALLCLWPDLGMALLPLCPAAVLWVAGANKPLKPGEEAGERVA